MNKKQKIKGIEFLVQKVIIQKFNINIKMRSIQKNFVKLKAFKKNFQTKQKIKKEIFLKNPKITHF